MGASILIIDDEMQVVQMLKLLLCDDAERTARIAHHAADFDIQQHVCYDVAGHRKSEDVDAEGMAATTCRTK